MRTDLDLTRSPRAAGRGPWSAMFRPTTLRLLLVLTTAMAVPAGGQERGADPDLLFQVSTLAALSAGAYDGLASIGDVRKRGDFGLGTFEGLDGEMVVLDGRIYQVAVDGIPRQVDDGQLTPFAAVTHFAPDHLIAVDGPRSCDDLLTAIEPSLISGDRPVAIRIAGRFPELITRSVPAQTRPFPPLDEALQQQVTFRLEDVGATMVGFWVPQELAEVNVPGFHFHALTDDGRAGGHVLNCQVGQVTVEIDDLTDLQIQFGDREPPRRPLVNPGRGDRPRDKSGSLSHW